MKRVVDRWRPAGTPYGSTIPSEGRVTIDGCISSRLAGRNNQSIKLTVFIVLMGILSGMISFGCLAKQSPRIRRDQSEQIELYSGEIIKDNILSLDDGLVVLASGRKLKSAEVKEVIFISQTKATKRPTGTEMATEEIQKYLAQAQEASAKYPEANGIILLDDGQFTLNPDGTQVYRYHFIGKVLTNKTKDWASLGFYLEEERDRTNVILARTITPDGKISELDRSDIKIAAPSREMAFFGEGKSMTLTIPDVEVGNLIEYIYEVETFNPWDKNIFEPGFYFQDKEPILLSRFTVTVPSDKELNYCAKNMTAEQAKPKITQEKSMTSYEWENRNVDAIIEEPSMPVLSDVEPHVVCSLFKDWSYLNNWEARMETERMVVTPELEKTVLELTKDAKTTEDKMAALYYFAQRQIRYISIKGSASSGQAGHPAYQTLQNRYGDCIDKAVLFATMLKVIGVEAYPVGVRDNTTGTAIRDIPILDNDHAINEIHYGGRVFYLDPVTTNYRYPYFNSDDHGVTAVNDITKKINFIEVPPPEDNLNNYVSAITITPNGDTTVDTLSDYTGDYESYLRDYWQTVPKGQRPVKFQEGISALSPGAQLTGFDLINLDDVSQPLNMRQQYVLPNYPVLAGNLMILDIPNLQYSFREIALEQRKYVVEYRTSRETRHQITLKMPAGYQVKFLPEAVNLDCQPYGTYQASYETQSDEIIFKDDFKRYKRIIPVADYQTYKKFLQNVAHFSQEKIFLIKEGKE